MKRIIIHFLFLNMCSHICSLHASESEFIQSIKFPFPVLDKGLSHFTLLRSHGIGMEAFDNAGHLFNPSKSIYFIYYISISISSYHERNGNGLMVFLNFIMDAMQHCLISIVLLLCGI